MDISPTNRHSSIMSETNSLAVLIIFGLLLLLMKESIAHLVTRLMLNSRQCRRMKNDFLFGIKLMFLINYFSIFFFPPLLLGTGIVFSGSSMDKFCMEESSSTRMVRLGGLLK